MSYFNAISYSDSGSVDAFQRVRTSSPETIFQFQSQYDTNPLKMENGTTGTGVAPSWSSSNRMITISATAGTGTCYSQSYQYFPYQPGMSQFIAITGVMGAGVAGAVKEFGYFDAANGIIYRQNGASGIQMVRRTSTSGSVAEEVVNQSSWNVDKMDGTGPSGITLDVTKTFILVIDLQFLGMGRVRIGFDINGILYIVHQFLNANNLTVPYMQTASLPIQILLTATSTLSTSTCYLKCATVQSEGGFIEELGYNFSTPSVSLTAASGTRTHAISIRPKTTFGGVANRSLFIFNSFDLLVTGNNPVYWELCTGVAFSVAPTYADINTTSSAFEYGTGGTYSSVGGVVISSGYVTSNNKGSGQLSNTVSAKFPVSLNRAGATTANTTLTLLLTGISGSSASYITIDFIEIR